MSDVLNGIMETQRSSLEELERIEQAVSDRIVYNPRLLPESIQITSSSSLQAKRKRPLRDTLTHQHEIYKFLDRYDSQAKYLVKSFDNEQQEDAQRRKAELNSIKISSEGGFEALFTQFHKQVGAIKEFHRRYPNEGVQSLEDQYKMRKVLDREKKRKLAVQDENGEAELISASTSSLLSSMALDLDIDTIFSGEEFYGRFLDLISLHEQFINLKFVQRKLTYLQFLDKFYDFSDEILYPLSYRLRQGDYFKDYVAYLLNLHQYLESFLVKTSPLSQHQTIIKRIEQEFDELWESNKLPDWIQKHKISTSNGGTVDGELNVSNNGGVYCKPCSKAFKNQAVYNGHLNGSKHKKNVAALGNSESNGSISDFKFRKISFHEYCIYSFALFLEKKIGDTKANLERRQALTDRERQLEIESLQREVIGDDRKSDSDDGEQDNSDDEQEEVIYNPLKLPLGWDGKPIPFWLWKLNGLGIEFTCEICGNYTYMGRKAFEIHFMEARHIHGLNCLGIESNLLMYRGITEISQAQALVSKFKGQQRRLESKTENAVEMEDEEGNVMSVKVYNDLKKQGLI